jgi:hypothetical protein
MKKKVRTKDRISEREYRDRLTRLLKSAFNPRLQALRSLKTATKKRRELKNKVARSSGFTKPSASASG